ncbi:MAG TPA: hypothetical protein VGU61_19725 [Noviherbaspirillum sp.]|jgi:hypothetical protein|uniref:hypothetical protein n=1 Tax=Noviherbaspirillum sp. TaxID=1926288 RepID=UPI002DDD192B|nr:hypothetical protein [Noviherbaspirillum sp.]HEV2612501.1 hypothetical protein [Noviherbaspirillum sp.]
MTTPQEALKRAREALLAVEAYPDIRREIGTDVHDKVLAALAALDSAQAAPAGAPEGWTIERADQKLFKAIKIKAPNGFTAIASSIAINPENVLYMLADALLAAAPQQDPMQELVDQAQALNMGYAQQDTAQPVAHPDEKITMTYRQYLSLVGAQEAQQPIGQVVIYDNGQRYDLCTTGEQRARLLKMNGMPLYAAPPSAAPAHLSNCATSNYPDGPVGPCSCGAKG